MCHIVLSNRTNVANNAPLPIVNIEEQVDTRRVMYRNNCTDEASSRDCDNSDIQNLTIVGSMNSDLTGDFQEGVKPFSVF